MPTAAASSTAGWREQRLVDLARRDVLAALDDQLLDAAGDEEEAVARRDGRGRRCAASRPAWKAARGRLLVLVVARHHLRSADHDLAGRAVGQAGCPSASTTRASQPEARPTEPSLRCAGSQRIGEGGRDGFGQAHRLDDADAELLLERAMVLRRQRGRRRAAEADVAQCCSRGGAVAFEQVGDDRRHHVDPGAARARSPAPRSAAAENRGGIARLPPCASGASIVTAKALM